MEAAYSRYDRRRTYKGSERKAKDVHASCISTRNGTWVRIAAGDEKLTTAGNVEISDLDAEDIPIIALEEFGHR